MSDHAIPARLLRCIEEKDHFLILGHTDPDGDCVAGQLVTAMILRRMGKTAECFAEKPFTRREIIPFSESFSYSTPAADNPNATAVIALDCSTLDRVAGYTYSLEPLPLIMIDHHSSGRPFGTLRYIDAEAASTTILIHRLMKALAMKPTEEEAQLLLFGLCTDTGFFRHLEACSGDTLHTAAELSEAGASLKMIYSTIYGGRSFGARVLLGRILSRCEFLLNNTLVFSYMTRTDLEEFGEEAKDSDTLYELLQGISGVVTVVLVREETDGTQTAGIRTNHTIDAGSLAARFGGGGHARAAGFSSSLGIFELRQELLTAMSDIGSHSSGN